MLYGCTYYDPARAWDLRHAVGFGGRGGAGPTGPPCVDAAEVVRGPHGAFPDLQLRSHAGGRPARHAPGAIPQCLFDPGRGAGGRLAAHRRDGLSRPRLDAAIPAAVPGQARQPDRASSAAAATRTSSRSPSPVRTPLPSGSSFTNTPTCCCGTTSPTGRCGSPRAWPRSTPPSRSTGTAPASASRLSTTCNCWRRSRSCRWGRYSP